MSLASQVTLGLQALAAATKARMTKTLGGSETTAAASGTTGTVTLDCAAASIFTLSPTGNCSIAITNVPASGVGVSIRLIVTQGGTLRTITGPTGVVWYGTTPVGVINKKTIYDFFTLDGGTSWHSTGLNQV